MLGTMRNDPLKPQQLSTVPLERGSGTEGGFSPLFRRSVPTLSLRVERGTICALRRVAGGTFVFNNFEAKTLMTLRVPLTGDSLG